MNSQRITKVHPEVNRNVCSTFHFNTSNNQDISLKTTNVNLTAALDEKFNVRYIRYITG